MTSTNSNSNSNAEDYYYGGADTRDTRGQEPWFEGTTKFRLPDRNALPEVHHRNLPEFIPGVRPFQPVAQSYQSESQPFQVVPEHYQPAPEQYQPAPEQYQPVLQPVDYSGPNVVREYYHPHPSESGDSTEAKIEVEAPIVVGSVKRNTGTICGIRRKFFLILLGVALFIIVAGAVGAGVGIAVSRNNQGNDSEAGDTTDEGGGGGGGGSSSPMNAMGLLSSTKLSAVNFTDEFGYENYIVFFQLRSRALCQSAYNASRGTWTATLVNNNTDILKEGTPITASMFWHSRVQRDTRLYFLDKSDKILGQITGRRGVASTLADWSASGISGIFAAASSSLLLSNGKETPDSYLSNLVIFQDVSRAIRVLRKMGGSTDWDSTPVPIDFGIPVNGSGLASVPVYQIGDRSLSLFYNSEETGTLKHLSLMYDNDWTSETLPTGLDKSAVIAAFSSGYNNPTGAGLGAQSNLTMQVLTVQPGKPVELTSFRQGKWTSDGEISTMAGDDAPLTIAANQAGRVYGTVEGSDGTVEIVEWAWRGDNKYERIGTVKTTF